jgi:hypothetical protein
MVRKKKKPQEGGVAPVADATKDVATGGRKEDKVGTVGMPSPGPKADLKARYLEKIKKRKRGMGGAGEADRNGSTWAPPPQQSSRSPYQLEADAQAKKKKKNPDHAGPSGDQHGPGRGGGGGDGNGGKRGVSSSPIRERSQGAQARGALEGLLDRVQGGTLDQVGLDGKRADGVHLKTKVPKANWKALFSHKTAAKSTSSGRSASILAGGSKPEDRNGAATPTSRKPDPHKQAQRADAGPVQGLGPSGGEEDGEGDGTFPYDADPSDHAETPAEAYADVAPLLEKLAALLGKTKETVRIYDPYYCNGGVVKRLGKHGFRSVYNRREDFYAAAAAGTTPAFDILLTNPPYSGEHPAKILDFCCASGKPWLLLVPNWVYTKDYYPWCVTSAAAPHGYVGNSATDRAGAAAASKRPKGAGMASVPGAGGDPVYLVPTERYTYWTPPWLHASKYRPTF